MLDIKIADIESKDPLVAWVEWKHGIKFHVQYVSKSTILRISQNALTQKYDRDEKALKATIDQVKFGKAFCDAAVINWEGVTLRILATLINVDLKQWVPGDWDKPIIFNRNNLAAMMTKVYDLDEFLQNVVSDVLNFRPLIVEEKENLTNGQDGSSTLPPCPATNVSSTSLKLATEGTPVSDPSSGPVTS